MGMDVYGQHPDEEVGSYFRSNVWWWRPIWNCTCNLAGDLIPLEVQMLGNYNDGEGLNEDDTRLVAERLRACLTDGRVGAWETQYRAHLDQLPDEDCYCTSDKWPEGAECHVCKGKGYKENILKSYPFQVEVFAKWVDFLEHCGGFEIH